MRNQTDAVGSDGSNVAGDSAVDGMATRGRGLRRRLRGAAEAGVGGGADDGVDGGDFADDRAPLAARIAVGLLVIGCLVGVVWGFGSEKNQTGEQLPSEIESVSPVPNALTVPGQSTLSVNMKFGYDADIIVDGVEIPRDQTKYEKATAVRTFTPGPGQEFRVFEGGVRRVMVVYYPLVSDRETSGESYSWTFTVT